MMFRCKIEINNYLYFCIEFPTTSKPQFKPCDAVQKPKSVGVKKKPKVQSSFQSTLNSSSNSSFTPKVNSKLPPIVKKGKDMMNYLNRNAGKEEPLDKSVLKRNSINNQKQESTHPNLENSDAMGIGAVAMTMKWVARNRSKDKLPPCEF